MVLLAENRSLPVRILDGTLGLVKALYIALVLFIVTLFGLKKESNKFTKDEINYLTKPYMPTKKSNSGQKPKVMRGLAGNADCNT